MMAESQTKTDLLPFHGGAIPQALQDLDRWAPWRASFNEKRGKWDKIPHRADRPEYGLSTADPDRWFTFAAALDAYKRNLPDFNATPGTPGAGFAGIGYVMTRPHGVVGVDLDNCITDGQLAPWAREVVDDLDSYTEVSPSGRGLRIFLLGEATDWTNHQVGIEVYGGTAPRFLTITGDRLAGARADVRALSDGVMLALRARYARDVRKVEVEALDLPELVDELLLPDVAALDLPYAVRDFLDTGEAGADRSRALHAAGVALYGAGLVDDEVLSILAANSHAMEVALDHRGQDTDRALVYLWKEHCLKAKGKAGSRVATADDFDIVTPEPSAAGETPIAPAKVVKGPRFRVQPVAEFLQRTPATWLVKGLLPQAGLAVVFGESGSGKTFFVLDVVGAVARGIAWRGRRVRQGAVVYVCAEGEAGFRNRLQAYCEFNGIDDLPLGVIPDAPNLLEKADVRDLLASVQAFGAVDIIVVDTFAQVMPGGNENSGEDVGRALAHCRALHRATGALVVLVHHAGKDSSKGARGWSGLRAAADVEVEIERSDNARAARVTKLKDGEDGAEFGFRLASVEIGTDEDGEPVTSCVVSHGEALAQGKRPKEPRQEAHQVVLELVRGAFEPFTKAELVAATTKMLRAKSPALRADNGIRAANNAVDALLKTWLSIADGVIKLGFE